MSLRMDAHGPSHREQTISLDQETLRNYEAAKNYYTQKKIYFLQQGLRKNLQDNARVQANLAQSIQRVVGNIVQDQWNPIKNTILQAARNPNAYQARNYKLQDTQLVGVPEPLKQELIRGQLGKVNLYNVLGHHYEPFLVDAFQSLGAEMASRGVQKCLSDFVHSGNTKMVQAGRTGSVEIMADISKNIIDNPNADLSISIDIAQARQSGNVLTYPDIVNYLTSGMFGVQCKLYAMGSSKWPLTEVSSIKNTINNTFANAVNNHTWNIQYAYSQILSIVSRYLLDIISPINIAFIDKNGLIWIDGFLEDHILYMALENINAHVYLNENTYTEIHPIVPSNGVFVRKFAIQKAINRMNAGDSGIGIVSSGSAYAANSELTQFTINTFLKRIK